MAKPEHILDIEFDNKIKKFTESLYESYEQKLKDLYIVKDDIENNENISKLEESDAERFFITHRCEIRQYLIKEKSYKYNGTGVWLNIPQEGDISSYYSWLISQY